MARDSGEKFVVVHSAVDGWTQGQVIARDDLKRTVKVGDKEEVYDAHDRLLGLGAIRAADEQEGRQERVVVLPGGQALSAQAVADLGARNAELTRLRALIGDLQERARFAALHAPPGQEKAAPEDPAVAALCEQKDQEIEKLRAEAESLYEQVEAHGKHQTEQAPAGPAAPEAATPALAFKAEGEARKQAEEGQPHRRRPKRAEE